MISRRRPEQSTKTKEHHAPGKRVLDTARSRPRHNRIHVRIVSKKKKERINKTVRPSPTGGHLINFKMRKPTRDLKVPPGHPGHPGGRSQSVGRST